MTRRRRRGRARNRTGSIQPVGERYRAQLRWGKGPRLSLGYFPSEDEAQHAIEKKIAELRRGPAAVIDGSWNPTIAEYAAVYKPKKLGRESTQQIRKDKLAPVVRHLGELKLRELTFEHADELINRTLMTEVQAAIGEPYAGGTRKLIRDNARAMLNVAMKDKRVRLPENVFSEVEVEDYEEDFEAKVMTEQDEKAFMEAAMELDDLNRAARRAGLGIAVDMTVLWRLKLRLGPRAGELLGVTWDNVDLEGKRLFLNKQLQRKRGAKAARGCRGTGEGLELVPLKTRSSKRVLKLTDAEVAELTERRKAQLAYANGDWNAMNLVFPTVNGLPMQHSTLQNEFFRRTCALAGLRYHSRENDDGYRVHDCRHTAATKMLRAEDDLLVVQYQLGHSTLEMTRRYLHFLTAEERRRVA